MVSSRRKENDWYGWAVRPYKGTDLFLDKFGVSGDCAAAERPCLCRETLAVGRDSCKTCVPRAFVCDSSDRRRRWSRRTNTQKLCTKTSTSRKANCDVAISMSTRLQCTRIVNFKPKKIFLTLCVVPKVLKQTLFQCNGHCLLLWKICKFTPKISCYTSNT